MWSLNVLNGLGVLYLFIISIVMLDKQHLTKYFLISWSAFLIGVSIFQLENIGWIDLDGRSTWVMAASSLLECILFSIIIGAIHK